MADHITAAKDACLLFDVAGNELRNGFLRSNGRC